MTDENSIGKVRITTNSNAKPKEKIRVFVRRKRLSHGIRSKSNTIEKLTSIIEKNLNVNKKKTQNNKNIIVINYKPVFMNSRPQKSTETKLSKIIQSSTDNVPSTTKNNPVVNTTPLASTNKTSNSPQVPFSGAIPDVEDPFVFIEMMYQQLFTDDGQLRSGAEPALLANCVKEIVTKSRRGSLVARGSLTSHIHHDKHALTSFQSSMLSKQTSLSSPCILPTTFSTRKEEQEVEEEEEDDDFYTLLQATKTPNISRRSSRRASIDEAEAHLEQLRAFVNSYRQPEKRTSKPQTRLNPNDRLSVDDTDNEDFDGFSDFNSYRRAVRTSLPVSIDEDITPNDSKLLSSSSGYQSLQSTTQLNHNLHAENDTLSCPHCVNTPRITITRPKTELSLIQPMQAAVSKLFNFFLFSKNIFLLPLCIFLVHQRPINIRY